MKRNKRILQVLGTILLCTIMAVVIKYMVTAEDYADYSTGMINPVNPVDSEGKEIPQLVGNTLKGNQWTFAMLARNDANFFINKMDTNILGKWLSRVTSAEVISTRVGTCLGHVTNEVYKDVSENTGGVGIDNAGFYYNIANIIDIDESTNMYIRGARGNGTVDGTIDTNVNQLARLVDYCRYKTEDSKNPINELASTSVSKALIRLSLYRLALKMDSWQNTNASQYMDPSFKMEKIYANNAFNNFDKLINYANNANDLTYMEIQQTYAYGEGIYGVGPITLNKPQTEQKSMIERIGNNTYIGPFQISYAGASVNNFITFANDSTVSGKFVTKTNGVYNVADVAPNNNNNFYIMLENRSEYASNIKNVKIETTEATSKRIKARMVLLRPSYSTNTETIGAQYITIFASEIVKNIKSVELKLPAENDSYATIKFQKLDSKFSKPIEAKFEFYVNNKLTDTKSSDKNGNMEFKFKIDGSKDTPDVIKIREVSVVESQRYEKLKDYITINVTKKTYNGTYVANTAVVSGNGVDNKTYDFTTSESQDKKLDSEIKENIISIYDTPIINTGKVNLYIIKIDGTNKEKLDGVTFKIVENDLGIANGTEYKTDNNGSILIQCPISKEGKYKIKLEESKSLNNYAKINGTIDISIDVTVVDLGNSYIYKMNNASITNNPDNVASIDPTSNNQSIKITVSNKKEYIKLSGYVWLDKIKSKSDVLGVKDSSECYVSNIKVIAHTKGDSINIPYTDKTYTTADVRTNSNGYYEFNLPKTDIGYYIEFIYNGQNYEHTLFMSDNGTRNSKSTEEAEDRKNLNAKYAEISVSNKAPYPEEYKEVNGVVQALDNKTYQISAYSRKKANNANGEKQEYVNTTSEINLGLVLRDKADIAIAKDVYSVDVSLKKAGEDKLYTQTYIYDEMEDILKKDNNNVNYWEASARLSDMYYGKEYVRKIKTSDYEYAKNQGAELTSKITYKITIFNQSDSMKVNVTELVDYYDSGYEFVKAVHGTETSAEGSALVTSDTSIYGNSHNINIKGFSKKYINVNTISIASSEYAYIYVTLDTKTINTKPEGYGNLVELTGYKTYYGKNSKAPNANNTNKTYKEYSENTVAGRIDYNSVPGNGDRLIVYKDKKVLANSQNVVENDTDSAPYLVFEKGSMREVTGNVWIDEKTVDSGNYAKVGDGIKQDEEKALAGVTVQLIEKNGNQAINYGTSNSQTITYITGTTDNNGNYRLSGFIPGEYYVKFIYPDGQTYKATVCNYNEIFENSKSFNINNLETEKSIADQNLILKNSTIRYSDAIDIKSKRTEINNSLGDETNLSLSNYQTKSMEAITGKFSVNIELESNNTNSAVNRKYEIESIDLGLAVRPKSQLKIDKKVASIQVVLANGNVLFDANGKGAANVWWPDEKNAPSTYNGRLMNDLSIAKIAKYRPNKSNIQLTMDNELMYGAVIKIKYNIIVTNIGEVDYNTNEFYYLGKSGSNDQIVKTTVYDIVDYPGINSTNLEFSSAINKGWEEVKINSLKSAGLISGTAGGKDTAIRYTFGENNKLTPLIANTGDISTSVELTLSKVINSNDSEDDRLYQNSVEIIKIKNDVGRKSEYSTVGNYNVTKNELEIDTDEAPRVTILPPFGQTYGKYIITGIIAILAIFGLIVIKLKIKKR